MKTALPPFLSPAHLSREWWYQAICLEVMAHHPNPLLFGTCSLNSGSPCTSSAFTLCLCAYHMVYDLFCPSGRINRSTDRAQVNLKRKKKKEKGKKGGKIEKGEKPLSVGPFSSRLLFPCSWDPALSLTHNPPFQTDAFLIMITWKTDPVLMALPECQPTLFSFIHPSYQLSLS